MTSAVDYRDIQGLAAFGYGKLVQASYYLAQIRDAHAAARWCVAASAKVATAEYLQRPPDTALQIAFTAAGLRAMGVPEAILNGFSSEFLSGMSGEASRSRRLGDAGANDPAAWYWGGPDRVPHIVAMFFARENLAGFAAQFQDDVWKQAFADVTCLGTSDMKGVEPFGFRDGISQPDTDWKRELPVDEDRVDYSNRVALGEFILGYRNEYGKYTDRPLVHATSGLTNELPPAEDDSGKKDVGRNGTYLVVRQLEQDVRGFWQFLDKQCEGNANMRDNLSAAMVGRRRTGDPLATTSARPIAGIPNDPLNSFTFGADATGTLCPFGAHIRRANPRNADLFGRPRGFITRTANKLGIPRAKFGDDLLASARFHRILRRGREYGAYLTPEDALLNGPAGDPPRGLQFACLNANIARQFEFVQGAWLMNAKFNGMTDEADPLLGNSNRNFSIPQAGALKRFVAAMPQFITVRGGAYFFLPGISALRFLARVGGS